MWQVFNNLLIFNDDEENTQYVVGGWTGPTFCWSSKPNPHIHLQDS